MPDDATVEIILRWKQEQEHVLAQVQANLALVTAQVAATNAVIASVTTPAWQTWAIAIAATAGALWPFTALLASAVAVTAAFAISGAATVSISGAASLGFAALGAGAVYLAYATGNLAGPIAGFVANLK